MLRAASGVVMPNCGATAAASHLDVLHEFGWIRLRSGLRDDESLQRAMLEIGAVLGKPTRGRSNEIVEHLTPKTREMAKRASLSKNFGLEKLPFHVDMSHWTIPAKYIILGCLREGLSNVPTLLLDYHHVDFRETELKLLQYGLFFVNSGRDSFYASITSINRMFIRFDPGCMEPVTPEAVSAIDLFSHQRVSHLAHAIHWQAGDIVIIDNWRTLHARCAAHSPDEGRTLLRCIVP